MKRVSLILSLLSLFSCGDDPVDNSVEFDFQGGSHLYGSNDGSCQMRNQSSNMYCFVDVGRQPEEDDLSFSLGVAISEVIEEGTYTDLQETATPSVAIDLWIEDHGGEIRHFETPISSRDPQTMTITRLETSSIRGSFEGVLECEETGASEAISATFSMTLNQ